jgi:hypothetical protein
LDIPFNVGSTVMPIVKQGIKAATVLKKKIIIVVVVVERVKLEELHTKSFSFKRLVIFLTLAMSLGPLTATFPLNFCYF